MLNFYAFIRLLVTYVHHLLYKDIVVLGKENIPANSPTIIFANHNNYFLDSTVIHQLIQDIRPILW